uniref:SEA domain-containing protein n=1 Tax=Angiostrongylus cantonensis TaxID=6313 RepID=A0A158P952_ANGCA
MSRQGVLDIQNEKLSKIFDLVPKEVLNEDAINSAEFVGNTHEVNEGSDSFVTSTELLEPITTESTVTTDRHQTQTLEPLELTTAQDNNATLQVPNVPAVNADDTHPLPPEVLVADPFSFDEAANVEHNVDVSPVAPVVPVVHKNNTSFSTVTESDDNFFPSTMVREEVTTTAATVNVPVFPSALERRVLKEKEEATVPIISSATNAQFEAETIENFPSSTESHLTDASIEPIEVAVNPMAESDDFKDATLNSDVSLSSDSTTDLSEAKTPDVFAHASKTTEEQEGEEHSAFTETNPVTISSTATTETTVLDEDEPPFDQEKLSGLFEQDGSFIPDHLINQMSTTTGLPMISVSSDDHEDSAAMTNFETVSTKHKLQQTQQIHTSSSKDFVNEVFQTAGTLSPTFEQPRFPVESSAASTLSQGDVFPSAAASTSPELESEHSIEFNTWPTLIPTSEVTFAVTEPELDLATPDPEAIVESSRQPTLESEVRHRPETQPQPILKLSQESEPTARPNFKLEFQPQPSLEPAAPKMEPEPQPQAEPQAVGDPSPMPELKPEPEPTLPDSASQPKSEPQPKLEWSSGDLKNTLLSMRITSVEFVEEFTDKSSGQYRKLIDQVIPHISSILKTILGDNFVGYDITSITKGSVVIEGVIMTRDDIHDAEELATKIDMSISSNGFMVGPNEVDPRSIAVNGIPSRGYIERVHSSYPQTTTSSALLIGSMIAVGVLIVLVVAFVAIAMNNRRSNGTMKLKDGTITRIESGKAAYSNPQAVSVNL